MLITKRATITDLSLINDMANVVFRDTYRNILSPQQMDYMIEWMYSLESLHQQIAIEGHVYYIAYWDDEPCGYISVEQQEADVFHLQKIYVMPGFQGKGIGKDLFLLAISDRKSVV